MSTYKFLVAKSLLKKELVKLVHRNDKLIIFEVDGANVMLNHKGWLCDYLETEESYENRCTRVKARGERQMPSRWSCSFNQGKICKHILAAKMYLQKFSIENEHIWKG